MYSRLLFSSVGPVCPLMSAQFLRWIIANSSVIKWRRVKLQANAD